MSVQKYRRSAGPVKVISTGSELRLFVPEENSRDPTNIHSGRLRTSPWFVGDPMNYSVGSFKSDLVGGISVAALSIPIAVAFAEIAGMPPESGIYTAVFALVAYFILGSSNHVIMGTDFPTITLFAAVVIAAFGSGHRAAPQLMMMVTVMAGIWMFIAGMLKLGFIASFLSKPILLGYLNGVSILLIVSQLDKLTGIPLQQESLFPRIAEVLAKAQIVNWPTLLLGVGSIVFLLSFPRLSHRFPAAIVLFVISVVAAKLFDFGSMGIAFMPAIQNTYPNFILPDLRLFVDHFSEILFASAAVMFVSYASAIPVVRGLSKDVTGFDPNREFFALGLAHVLIGFFGGYPVSADDSRTAVNVGVGGKTRVVNLVAAFVILLTVFVVPGILTALPLATMGAVIAAAGIGMFERGAGLRLLRIEKSEFLVFAVCVAGVLLLGVYQGILFAIILAILQLIKRSSKPNECELVYDQETGSASERTEGVLPSDEVLLYRFGSALLFYNVEYFKERVTRLADSKAGLRLVVIDAAPINMIDLTAAQVLGSLIKDLTDAGVRLAFAAANESFQSTVARELESNHLNSKIFYPSIRSALFDSEALQ